MKRIIKIVFIVLTAGIFASCTKTEDPDNPVNFPNEGKLQVKAALYSGQSQSAFGTDEQIGIFVCNNTGNMYDDDVVHVNVGCKSRGPDAYWLLDQEIRLTSEDNTVFAYYPFKPGITNLKKIPVDITKMEDLCFGINDQQTVLNRTQPVAIVTMRHALAKIRFNLIFDKNEGYYGPGIIDNARVVKLKPDGTVDEERYNVLTIEGMLDATTGTIATTTSGKMPIEMLVGKVFSTEGITEDKMPFFYSVPETGMKEYAFAITIDGKQHILRIDHESEWRAGTINTYTFRLKGESLVLDQTDGNGFTVKPWQDVEKEIDC